MYYVMRVLNILNNHRVFALCVTFGALALFAAINWLHDPYRKQNKRMRNCIKCVNAFPDRATFYARHLPNEYRRQWRAYINCGTDKPALVFEFAPIRCRLLALWLFVGAACVMTSYIAVYFAVNADVGYLVMQPVFWLSFMLTLLMRKLIARGNERRAKRLFAQFVTTITRITPPKSSTVVEETVKELNKLNRQEVNDAVVGKAGEILRNRGLDAPRTIDEQRRINSALNGLLQSYAQNAKRNNG